MTRRTLLASAVMPFAAKPGPQSLLQTARIEWIALDCDSRLRAASWSDTAASISMGSLLKPFLLLAYLRTHRQPLYVNCTGCWYPKGHGKQNAVTALANSCNTYFLEVAKDMDRAALDAVCLSFGLDCAGRASSPERLIGLACGWPQSPAIAARAFARLTKDRDQAGVRTVLAGMAQCARIGTARAVGFECYAKTGTAAADGFAVALYPLDQPRRVLLVREHNTTGANTAKHVKALAIKAG